MEEERLFWSLTAKAAAHDMGTPLSAMMGWLELLPSLEDPTAAIAEMQSGLKRLDELSKRLESLGPPYRLQPCRLDEILEETLAFFRRRIPPETSGITFRKESVGDPRADCRRELIGWALETAIKNSLDALPGYQGVITLKAFYSGDNAVIEVTDDGKGIPPEAADNLFRVGFSTKQSGRGVGLALVKYIIEKVHGGSAAILPVPAGRGTTLKLTLPRPTD